MNKILWPLVAFCSVVSIYWLFTGIGPRAIPVIKPSNFNSAAEIAEYSYRQLYPRLANYRSFVFGVEDNRSEQREIFRRFTQLLVDGGKKPFVVVSDTQLETKMFEPAQVELLLLNDIPEKQRRQRLNEILLADKNVIFFLSAFDAAHLRRESMINVIEEAMNLKSISFVMARLGLNADEMTIASLCVPPIKDEMNYNPIACLVRTKSANLQQNKKIDRKKLVGFVERQSENDFMIYTWVP